MKTNRLLFGALSACFAFGLLAAQSVRADDSPVTLVRKDTVGETRALTMKLTSSLMGAEVKVEQKLKETTKEIKKTGEVVVEQKDEGSKVSINGMDMDQPPGPSATTTRTKLGKMVDWKVDKEDEQFLSLKLQRLLEALNETLFPEKAVKAGDSWETEIANPVIEDKKVKVKSTYVGTDKVDGVDLWKIKQTAEPVVNGDGDKVTHEQTVWIDPANGRLVKAEQEVKDIPTQLGKLSWKVKIEAKAVKAEKAEKEAK
ncbi:MAG TPA: hypothetical protein VKU00_05345 [Chthonomonadaceae bacterium]|nr:hypothetical protein [Chthonomonadaceae bacterium]